MVRMNNLIDDSRLYKNAFNKEEKNRKWTSTKTKIKFNSKYIWQNYVKEGDMAGTEGQSKRLEGINIKLLNNKENISIRYQVHVQDIGWQGWKTNDEMAGTSGRSLRLEGIRINLVN